MKNKIVVITHLLVILIATVNTSSFLDEVLRRSKRDCPLNYYTNSCQWGCCKNGAPCGYNYYPCSTGCCGPRVCPSGYFACSTPPNYCCRISACPANTLKCDGDSTYGGSYCCPAGTGCCKPTYAGTGGLCCTTSCGVGYSSCHYGCCPNKDTCGFGYYRASSTNCAAKKCSTGYAACATASNRCCRVVCGAGQTSCNYNGNSYCCASGYICCNTYNKNYGGILGACCPKSVPCGVPPLTCCGPNTDKPYNPTCSEGSCVNGYCAYTKKG